MQFGRDVLVVMPKVMMMVMVMVVVVVVMVMMMIAVLSMVPRRVRAMNRVGRVRRSQRQRVHPLYGREERGSCNTSEAKDVLGFIKRRKCSLYG